MVGALDVFEIDFSMDLIREIPFGLSHAQEVESIVVQVIQEASHGCHFVLQ